MAEIAGACEAENTAQRVQDGKRAMETDKRGSG